MTFEISREPFAMVPVTAVIVTPPDMRVPEFVINALEPFITQLPSQYSAVVWVAPASEPAFGSVRPNDQRRSPAANCGTKVFFWSSLPNIKNGIVPREVWAAIVIPTEASPRPISSTATAYERVSEPAPPYSSGTGNPINPSSAN